MIRMGSVSLLVFGFILNWNMVLAADVYVESSGSCGGKTPCSSTIQGAINVASSGDTIKVAQGIYAETYVLGSGSQLTFQGGWDAGFTTQTPRTTSIRAPIVTNGAIAFQELRIMEIVSNGGNLPDTGQTTCYDNTASISCPSPGQAFYGQDGNYTNNPPSYTDNGNGTVTDNVTGLMWQQYVTQDRFTWYQATSLCSDLSLAGYTDWRLPAIKELMGIIHADRYLPPVDTTYFLPAIYNTWINGVWWSSTPYVDDSSRVWGMEIEDGATGDYPKSPIAFITWCVRAGGQ